MTREESIFLVKKLFVELVHSTVRMENLNITFPQTQVIIDGGIVNNIPVNKIQTVLNLKHAWQYMIQTIGNPLNLDYICKINSFVANNESLDWGVLRYGSVGVSGTDYTPPIPIQKDVIETLNLILGVKDPIERALEYFCYVVKSQLFWDGNKRTSTIIANKILIEDGVGVLSIREDKEYEFAAALNKYYNTDLKEDLKTCLQSCIKTIQY